MVVAAGVVQLEIVLPDTLAYPVRLAEVEGRTLHRSDFPGGDAERIDGNIGRCIDLHNIVLHRTRTFAAQAEEGVVRKVHRSGLVGNGRVAHAEDIFGSERIGHIYVQVARIAFIHIRALVVEDYRAVADAHHFPDHIVKALITAVQRIHLIVIGRSVVVHTVDVEARTADTVCHRPHAGPEEALSGRSDVLLQSPVSHHDRAVSARTVGSVKRDYAGTEVGDLQADIAGAQSIERHRSAVYAGVEIFGIHKTDTLAGAGQSHQDKQGKDAVFHIKNAVITTNIRKITFIFVL